MNDGGDTMLSIYNQIEKYQQCSKARGRLHPNRRVRREVAIEVCVLDKVLEILKHALIYAGKLEEE